MAALRTHSSKGRLALAIIVLVAVAVGVGAYRRAATEIVPPAAQFTQPQVFTPAVGLDAILGMTDVAPQVSAPVSVEVTDQPKAIKRERVARLSEILENQPTKVILRLFPDVTATAMIEHTENLAPDRVVVWGQLAGVAGSEFIMAREGQVFAATIFIPAQGQFEIRYLGDGRHVVREVDPEKLPQCGTEAHLPQAADPEEGAAGGTADVTTASDDGVTVLDIMVAYTAQARTAAGGTAGINTVIDLAVAQANLSYQNSQINARLNLVYRGEVAYTESGSMNTDLSRVTSTSDDFMDEVHELRNTYGADLVSLFTSTGEAGYAGIAWVMCSAGPSFHRNAFSVVRQQYATSHTFAHEVGHNLGCSHDRANGGCGAHSYSYGHRFTASNGNQYRTVMSYAPGQRISYFSNPDVTYLGTPTGVPGTGSDSADNARTINITASIVAAFRNPPVSPPPPSPPADTTPPAIPGGLIADTVSTSQINLSWNAATDAGGSGLAGYRVFRGSTLLATTSATTYSATGLTPVTAYCFRVAAYDSAGNTSAVSSAVCATTQTAPPVAPGGLLATVISSNRVAVSWVDNAANETGFTLERAFTAGGPWSGLATVAANATGYLDLTVAGGQTYFYRVRAFNGGGVSAYSTLASATTPLPPGGVSPGGPVGTTVVTPVGTWEVQLRGAIRGTAYVTLTPQRTVEAVGMVSGSCGYFRLNGTWEYNTAGRAVGTFVRVNEESACGVADELAASFEAGVTRAGKFDFRGREGTQSFTGKGIPVSEHLDLSGHWLGRLVRGRSATTEEYLWEPTELSAFYDVSGEALEGRLMITSRNQLLGYFIRHDSDGDVVSVYAGKAKTRAAGGFKLKGRDARGAKHLITALPD